VAGDVLACDGGQALGRDRVRHGSCQMLSVGPGVVLVRSRLPHKYTGNMTVLSSKMSTWCSIVFDWRNKECKMMPLIALRMRRISPSLHVYDDVHMGILRADAAVVNIRR
jgi:hypothetical protein